METAHLDTNLVKSVPLDASLVKNLLDLLTRVQKHKCYTDEEWSKDELEHFIDVLAKANVVPL